MRTATKSTLLFFFILVSITGFTLAQPGGGNRPGGGGTRPTIAAPDAQATLPPIQVTPSGQREQITPSGQLPQVTPGGQVQLTPSGDWMNSIPLPENMPSSAEEIQAALESYNVPYDVSSLENVEMPPSSDVAFTAIVGFGQQYLGITIAPIYAAEFNAESSGTRPRPAQQPEGEMSAELEAILSQFPEEIQTMLANASGIAYAGLMTNGAAVVYTGECNAAQCSISMDSLQLQITEESLGAYGIYIAGSVSDANTALAHIKATYPALNNLPLTQITVETGYAFTAASGDVQTASVIAYYAGTVSAGEYTLVYVAVGVGEGYAEIVRGQ